MDPMAERFAKRQQQHKLEELAKKTRTKEENEADEKLVAETQKVDPIRSDKKADRNDPCPCGSGKKFNKCCGKK